MFVGHALLAFALAAALASRRLTARRAVAVGVLAGLFAAAPDLDMVYALAGLGDALGEETVREGFWSASTVTHRGATHSLLVAVPAAVAFAAGGRRGLALCGGLLAVALAVGGPLTGFVLGLFLAAGLLVGRFGRSALSARWVLGAALLGLLSHPFGDLFTGEPPALLWPLNATVFPARVAPFGDATLNLLLAFFLELAVIWAGVVVLARLSGSDLRSHLRGKAALGAAYAGAVLVLPPPTVHASYQFVFSVLAVGSLGAVPARGRPGVRDAALTGLAAVTLAGAAYAVAYVAL
jgi:membrane-bound metal-dependent hydrolase YbcI (DUF457 family)